MGVLVDLLVESQRKATPNAEWPLRVRRLKRKLDADDGAEFFYCGCALLQCGIFFGRELDLDDLFEAACAQFAGNADVEALNTVLALQIRRAGQDLLLVLQDGFDHFDCGCAGSVVGAAGLEVFNDLGAAVAGALDECFEPIGGQ